MSTSTSVSGITSTSVVVTINGLSNPPSAYVQFQANIGSMQFVWTDSNSTGSSTSHTCSGLSAGTNYTVTTYANYNGTNYSTGSASFMTRPNNFSWTYAKTTGGTYNLKASEWNSFIQRINDFHVYVFGSSYSWSYNSTSTAVGATFTANMFNEARSAIASMNNNGICGTVVAGNPVWASYLNNLVTCLNAIN